MKTSLETTEKHQPVCAKAAILAPDEFDNHLFWNLIYQQTPSNVDRIGNAAHKAGLTIQSHRFPDTFFPPLDQLLTNIAHTCSNPRAIFSIIKQCLPHSSRDPQWNQWVDSHLPPVQIAIDSINPPKGPNGPGPKGPDGPGPRGPDGPGPSGPNGPGPKGPNGPGPNDPTGPSPLFIGQPEAPSKITASAGVVPTTKPSCSLKLNILAGFMVALGAVAIVVAFAALNAATFGTAGLIVGGIGVACLLTGVSLFCKPAHSSQTPPLPQPGNTVAMNP